MEKFVAIALAIIATVSIGIAVLMGTGDTTVQGAINALMQSAASDISTL